MKKDREHKFYEWRHKIMARFFLAVGAVVLLCQSLYQLHFSRWAICGALILGAIFSVFAALMDRVNQTIINICYERGMKTEGVLNQGTPNIGVMSSLHEAFSPNSQWRTRLNYRMLLGLLYWGTAIIFTIFALIVAAVATGKIVL